MKRRLAGLIRIHTILLRGSEHCTSLPNEDRHRPVRISCLREYPLNFMSTDAPETIDHLLEHDDDETTAGNYFVTNYPPFHFWDANTAQHVRELIQRPSPKETPL